MLTRTTEFADAGLEETLTEDPPDLKVIRGGQSTTDSAPTESHGNTAQPSIINADLSLLGDIRTAGHIHLHGRIEGDVHCKGLLASDKARIKGAIVADAVLVSGQVLGPIHAARVILKPTARVKGDILCEWIKMEEGAHFDGRMRRVDNARKAKPAAKPAAKPQMKSIADMLQGE